MQHQKDIIIITAAGKGTWLRERLTPSAWIRMFGEGMISGYKEKMEKLREVDDRIYDWLKDLDKIAKQMRKAAKAARYVDVAILLAQINKRLQEVKAAGKEVKTWTDEEVLPFELEHKEELPSEKLFADDEDILTAEAGLTDLKRKWVARRLETEMRRQRKLAIKDLLEKTEKIVDFAQGHMSALSKARASGDIASYIRILNDISKAQTEFQNQFMPIYRKHLEPLVQKAMEEKNKLEEAEKVHQEEREELKQDVAKEVDKLHEKPEDKLPDSEPLPVARRVRGPQDLLISQEPEVVSEPSKIPPPPVKPPEGHKPGAFVGPGGHVSTYEPEKFVQPDLIFDPLRNIKLHDQPTVINPEELLMKARQQAPTKKTRVRKPQAAKTPVPTAAAPVPAPVAEAPIEKEPLPIVNTELEIILLKTAHRKFMAELFKAADQNDPYLLAAMLLKYAEQIEDVDLEKSLQLTAIAEGILDES